MRSLLTSLILCLGLMALPAAPGRAQTLPDSIEGTIRAQIDAFLADDYATAFTYASPNIKGLFGTPENFGAMVSRGYPMVDKPASVRMLESREVAGSVVQRVMVTDRAGATHVLDYQMIPAGEGWQINGVFLLPSVGVGV
jgi:hypothetical protein